MKLNKKTIYRVRTQELFDKIMEDAKKQGYTTLPSIAWHNNEEDTAVRIGPDGVLGFSRIGYYQENDDYDTYDFTEYKDIPEIYPINFGCVGIEAPDFKTAYEEFRKRINIIGALPIQTNVYTIRVEDNETTVITPDGKTATAKCHPDDEFDVVEGFRVALEKIRDSERKLTDEEFNVLNALQTLGCDAFRLDIGIEVIGFKNAMQVTCVDLDGDFDEAFNWLKDEEVYNIDELLDKYA